MPRSLIFSTILCGVLLLTFSCSHEKTREVANAPEKAAVPTITAEEKPIPWKDQCDQFEQILKKRVPEDELQAALDGCKKQPQENPFCYSIINIEELESKFKSKKLETAKVKKRRVHLSVRINGKGEILNWKEVRSASVATLLRSFNNLRKKNLDIVKTYSIRETECPNNAAVALAATLEDDLPNDVAIDEIAYLYEKSADCMAENPAEQEQNLTRAGVFYFLSKDYKHALEALKKSSEIAGTFTARALFWLARTHEMLDESSKAKKVLETLKTKYPFAFHTLVAMTSVKEDPGKVLLSKKSSAKKRSENQESFNSLLEQVEILNTCEAWQASSKLLDWATQDLGSIEPEALLYAAQLRRDPSDTVNKITLLSEVLYKNPSLISRETMDLYFPKLYFPLFEKHSQILDPYLLLAIARRESAFNAKAVSPAKALGLLQITLATGRRFGAKKKNLFEPEKNVEVASKYLTELMRKLDGNIPYILAAYNAGPMKLKNWTERYITPDPILFIDLLPYRETREYVASILRNYYWYRRLHEEKSPEDPAELLEIALGISKTQTTPAN